MAALGDALAALAGGLDDGYRRGIDAAVSQLEAAGVPRRARAAGEPAPAFALAATDGDAVDLAATLAGGPVVLSFFRGEWCSFCGLELAALLAAAGAIRARGATLVMLSPQPPSAALAAAAAREGARVAHDPLGGVALAYGLIYRMPEPLRAALQGMAFDLGAFYGSNAWLLPIPASYVVAGDGRIVLAHAEADFRRRLEPSAILAALDALRGPKG